MAKVYRVLGGIELFEGRASERRKEVALAASSGCEGRLEVGRQVAGRARRSESADRENELGEFGAFFPRSGEISQKSWGKQNGRRTVKLQVSYLYQKIKLVMAETLITFSGESDNQGRR